jgi:molybdate transport system ATP-binding protein
VPEETASSIRVRFDRPGFCLDVEFAWEERVAILFGPSGSGKTTVFESVLGLHPDAQSRVRLAGEWLESSELGIRIPTEQRRLGWVAQEPTLFPHLDVSGNLRFGLGRAGPGGEQALARAVEVLEIGDLLERGVDQLSGGERQRVALARAIASGPRALLLDEPLAALDLSLRSRVLPYLLRVRDELDLPMLYITHDPDEAMLLGEVAAVLDGGRVVATGPPKQVLWSRSVLPLSQALGLEKVLDAVALETRAAGEGDGHIETAKGLRLSVPWPLQAGETVCAGLRAEDVLVAVDPPGRISARNVIAGRVEECERHEGDVLVHVDAGDRITARLTPAAVDKLELKRGAPVFLVVKAYAIRRLR